MPVDVPSAETLKAISTRMRRIRLCEEQVAYQSSPGKIRVALHTDMPYVARRTAPRRP